MHIAAKFTKSAVIKFFIKNGANINALNSHKKSPLHLALERNRKEEVEVLVALGADIYYKDYFN